jgi:hypothetical protein
MAMVALRLDDCRSALDRVACDAAPRMHIAVGKSVVSDQDRDLDVWAEEQLKASGYRKPLIPNWLKYFLTVTIPIGLVVGLLRLIGVAADR